MSLGTLRLLLQTHLHHLRLHVVPAAQPAQRCRRRADDTSKCYRISTVSTRPVCVFFLPFFAVSSSPRWMSMYLGLSGKKGSKMSSTAAGMPVNPSMSGQPEGRRRQLCFLNYRKAFEVGPAFVFCVFLYLCCFPVFV